MSLHCMFLPSLPAPRRLLPAPMTTSVELQISSFILQNITNATH
jgi:hypothetical protein